MYLPLIFIGAIVFICIFNSEAHATTWTVDDDGGEDFASIQEAIDAASSGDTIRVYEGIYEENVVVDKNINIIGNGSEKTEVRGWVDKNAAAEVDYARVGLHSSGYWISSIVIEGNYAYVADGQDGLTILDITNRSDPRDLGHVDPYDLAYSLAVSGDYAYLACWDEGLMVIDISDPGNPIPVGHLGNFEKMYDLVVRGDYAYVADWDQDLVIVNISDPSNPVLEGEMYTDGDVWGVKVSGDYAYLADSWNGLVIANISDPENPFQVGHEEVDGNAWDLAIAGDYAYVNDYDYGLLVMDVRDKENPVTVTLVETGGGADEEMDVEVAGNYLYLADEPGDLMVVDISDPEHPVEVVKVDTESRAWAIEVDEDFIYFSDVTKGLAILERVYPCDTIKVTSQCTISDLKITNASRSGILVDADSVDIKRCTVMDNYDGIRVINGSENSHIHYCDIVDNVQYGINSLGNSGSSVNAIDNWWGAASGPYHPDNHSEGGGDNITDYVEFDPWYQGEGHYPPRAYIIHISPYLTVRGLDKVFHGYGSDEGEIVRFAWRSSIDDEFYNGTEPVIRFNALSNGTHLIHFKVQNGTGNWSEEVNVTVKVTGRPNAEIITISPNPAIDPLEIRFHGSGTDDGSIERYVWSINDSEFYNGTYDETYYEVQQGGTYTISLKVQDDHGFWSEEIEDTLIVHNRPRAIIELISPNPAFLNSTIHFIGRGFDDGTIERYLWRTDETELFNGTFSEFYFGDLNGGLPTGVHTIYLKVQDNHGFWSEEVWNTVIVHEQPSAVIDSISSNPAVVNSTTNFIGNGTDDGIIRRYAWRTDDGEFYNDTESEFNFSFPISGTHTIYLKVQDDNLAWSEEVNMSIIVHERPVARILSISPSPATEGVAITFRGKGTDDGSIVLYSWRTADLEIYNGSDSEFSYSGLSHGVQRISFKVEDNWGVWSDAVSIDVEILKDSDSDGIEDTIDAFPLDKNESLDSDDDGVGDNSDAFPHDPAASVDADGDGYPDLWNEGKDETDSPTGLSLDRYPDNLKRWIENDENDATFSFSRRDIIIGIIAVGIVGLLVSAILVENILYALISIVVLPLYSKLKKDHVLNQTNREIIYEYLLKNPGSNYTTIKRALNLGTSTLVHHLNILEREDYIRSKTEFRRKIFFPVNSGENHNNIKIKRPTTSVQSQILDYLNENGPTSMRDLEKVLSMKQPTLSYNIRKLVERGQVNGNGKRRNALYSLSGK